MASRYEVLLRRPGGINKTVVIEDCMSEQEARETAESMYGMEALRVTWKGSISSYTSSSTSSVGSNWSSSTDSDDGAGILGVMLLCGVAAIVMFVIKFWWIVLIAGIIIGGLLWLGRDEL